jgi:4-amino-4-deoxy-L-arabinose transferase-like glycosyltransferase
LFVGLAILAKGPAVFVFVGAFALTVLVIYRPLTGKMPVPPTAGRGSPALLRASFWLACPVCFAVAAPWYVYVALGAGGTFWQQFMGYEIVSRLISAPHGHAGPPGYYVLLSLAGWLPWTVLVPGAVFEAWRVRRVDRIARLLLIWCGVPWLFLELIPSKLPHYILPCYVPLAILFGRMWDVGLQQVVTRRQRFVLGLWAGVPMVLGAGLIVTAVVWHELAWSLAGGVAGAILLAGFALVGWFARQRRLWPAWGSAVGVIALFHVVAGVWVLPSFEPYRLSPQIAAQANALCGPNTEVLVCGYTEPTLFFYLQRPGRVVAAEGIPAALADGGAPRVLIVRDPELRASGLAPDAARGWHRVDGFNYVKGRRETVWITRHPA